MFTVLILCFTVCRSDQEKKICFNTCTGVFVYNDIPFSAPPPYSADLDTNGFGRAPQIRSALNAEDVYLAQSIQ